MLHLMLQVWMQVPEDTKALALLSLFVAVGIAARVLVPYLQALREHPETKFDKKYLVPIVISLVLNVMLVPTIVKTLPVGTDYLLGFLAGWATTDVSREGTKLLGLIPALKSLQ